MAFNDLSFRLYFAARALGVGHVLRRWPSMARRVKRLMGFPLQETPTWVRIRSGLSRGMWMRLDLPREVRVWRGEHETAVQEAILALLRPGAVVYDIGAHTGSISLGAARVAGSLGRVVAFEADPRNVSRLRENCLRNNLTASLQIVPSAVWTYTALEIPFRCGGTQRMHGGVEADGQRPVLGSGEVLQVPAVALDDFIASGGPVPLLVKIDVEGGEYEVLRGGGNLFGKQRPLIIAEVHHDRAAQQIDAWLIEHDYRSHWTIPNENFPRCLFAWPSEYDGAEWIENIARTPH